ncbi:hypothetical protein [Plantactinospora endophytica]|uniref:Uncharacterized protein n=1 Tax=Plantactinospora endophytica TaxID=673535 RepID=A0ABQ4E5P4_9ACTN|nr:hypothetical protein [Plantactinospora endophytica]GIG90022.1 hypothetical protein Pen02_49580 [Plantactinospora endophytica]
MIVGSLVLILAAVALLVLGLASGSSGLLISSIAVSLLAAVALVVGARQAAGVRGAANGHVADGPGDDELVTHGGGEAGEARRRRPPTSSRMAPTDPRLAGAGRDGATDPFPESGSVLTDPVEVTVPTQATRQGADDDTGWRQPAGTPEASVAAPAGQGEPDDDVPADEPAPQPVSEADAALVAALLDDVYVVDGRPRYHLPDCPHLSGRESEPIPVSEAVELGFTPCGRCEPDTALLTDARPG